MSERKLPDQIADYFIALIFVESLKAGDKLPPERQLAELLQVDRTSLRTALKILTRMNLLESVQGSGITILDMRSHAGVDMLDNVLRIPEIQLGSDLLIQAVQSFTQLLPVAFIAAIKAYDQSALLNLIQIFQQQKARAQEGSSVAELAASDVQLQDSVARVLNQPLMLMAANSSRRVRQMLMTMLYEHVNLHEHFEKQLSMLQAFSNGSISLDILQQQYKTHIQTLSGRLIEHLKTFPCHSYLKTSPLKHLPELIILPQEKENCHV